MRRTLCLLLLVLAVPCGADDWVSPQPIEARSPDGRYSVDVDLGDSWGDSFGFAGAKKGEYAKATVTGPDGKRRTFKLLNPVSPVDVALLDDGRLLAFDNWHNLGYGAVVACYSPQGEVRWSRRLEDLFAEEVRSRIPTSVSSRWWRKQPLEWRTGEDETGRAFGLLTLWNEDRLKLFLDDGTFEYVQVQLGEDPERLLRRGQDLLSQEEYAKAAEVLQRAIALDPHLIEAHRTLAEVYSRQENHALAIKVLEDGIRLNPPVGVRPVNGYGSEDPRMWLWVALERAYVDAGRLQDAEKTLLELRRIDPTDWLAVADLARLWLDRSRGAEADQLLAQYLTLRTDPPENTFQWNTKDAARSVGGLYESRGLHEKARDYYLRAYDGKFDVLVSPPLAEVLEQLGQYDEALAVLRQSREWYSGQKAFQWDLERTEKSIQRVTEKKQARNTAGRER